MGQNKKQTAIEWLVEEINKRKAWANPQILEPLINHSKKMEKEQIMDAYDCALFGHGVNGEPCASGGKYYNETYEQ